MTPPVNEVRDVLRRVDGGAFDIAVEAPAAVTEYLEPQEIEILTWALQEGLIDVQGRPGGRKVALTELGRRYVKIIGGDRG